MKQQALLLCRVSLEGIHWSISGGNKLSRLKYYDRLRESTPNRLLYCAYQTQLQMLSVPNDNQQCCLRNVQLWLDDQGVGAPYTNVKCAVAQVRASYLKSNYGEQARARSSRLRTYQLMSCTTESGYSYAHQSYLQAITNVQLTQSLSRFRCANHRLEVECGRHVKPERVPAYSYAKENGSLEMKKHSWEAKKEDRFDPILCHNQSVDAWHHISDLGQMLQTRRS
jgi:hypothetical protein